MIKYDQSFHQSNIFIKMVKPLLVIIRIAGSNQPHMDKIWFVVLVVYDRIRMYMIELNDEDYSPPVTEL